MKRLNVQAANSFEAQVLESLLLKCWISKGGTLKCLIKCIIPIENQTTSWKTTNVLKIKLF